MTLKRNLKVSTKRFVSLGPGQGEVVGSVGFSFCKNTNTNTNTNTYYLPKIKKNKNEKDDRRAKGRESRV